MAEKSLRFRSGVGVRVRVILCVRGSGVRRADMVGWSMSLMRADCCHMSKLEVLVSFGNVKGLWVARWVKMDGSNGDRRAGADEGTGGGMGVGAGAGGCERDWRSATVCWRAAICCLSSLMVAMYSADEWLGA